MQKANLWDWVKAVCTIIIVLFLCLKFYNATFTMNFDFIALLSTILALFSVGLSAVFYFKATETSNNFYDNTFKFTKDIADLLIRIESGFGERLKSLDEGYNSMRNIMNSHNGPDLTDTKEKIEQEESELNKVEQERNKLIEQLLEKTNLENEEKDKIQTELKIKEDELQKVQVELARLKKRLHEETLVSREMVHSSFDFNGDESPRERVAYYISNSIVPELKELVDVSDLDSSISLSEIIKVFNERYWGEGKSRFAKDMISLGMCKPGLGLNGKGAGYIRRLIRRSS
jgi:hypothetical protein